MWTTEQIPGVYLVALCCWREARGESKDGWRGVIHVIRNRALHPGWWGSGYEGVVLAPMQFSSFNHGDPNADKLPPPNDGLFSQILQVTSNIMSGDDEDLTGGATHYHTRNVFPEWAAKMQQTAEIGQHLFYK